MPSHHRSPATWADGYVRQSGPKVELRPCNGSKDQQWKINGNAIVNISAAGSFRTRGLV
jgi:hypothetical protein